MNPQQRIFDQSPRNWKQLQQFVAQTFLEMNCRAEQDQTVFLPRGEVKVDVLVHDQTTVPDSLYVCECKHWSKRVPKNVVHAFRTVIVEIGAHRGFVISRIGFQTGARAAAQFTNIDLLSWSEFEQLMFDRWLESVSQRLDPLFAKPHALMDPNDEDLWRGRKYSKGAYEELSNIRQRYPLISVWSVCQWHSNLGFGSIPALALTDMGVLSPTNSAIVLNSYRKIVDSAPRICRVAFDELQRFWAHVPIHS